MKKGANVVLTFIFILYVFTLLGCNTSSNTDYKTFAHELEKNGGVRATYNIKDFGDRKITDSQFKDIEELIKKSFYDFGYKSIYISLDQSKYIMVEMVWNDNCKIEEIDKAFENIANTKLQDIELEINTIKTLSPSKK